MICGSVGKAGSAVCGAFYLHEDVPTVRFVRRSDTGFRVAVSYANAGDPSQARDDTGMRRPVSSGVSF